MSRCQCNQQKDISDFVPKFRIGTSHVILENFDSTYVKSMGTSKYFLYWKGQKYRVDMEVMSQNVLLRKTTFLMGIL